MSYFNKDLFHSNHFSPFSPAISRICTEEKTSYRRDTHKEMERSNILTDLHTPHRRTGGHPGKIFFPNKITNRRSEPIFGDDSKNVRRHPVALPLAEEGFHLPELGDTMFISRCWELRAH